MNSNVIKPQPGPQEEFLSNPADIIIYGGAAGGGKTWGLLVEPLRHSGNPKFGGIIFRRTSPQIRNLGGLLDQSNELYPLLGAELKDSVLEWTFRSGMRMKFSHMEYEKNKLDHQGSAYAYIGWDELTHFTESQFFYLLSRNRSMCGVRPYVRASTNPKPDSWVAEFIAWWINQDTGYPIQERAGKIRWFVRKRNEIKWFNTKEGIIKEYGGNEEPLSVTFIPARVQDNKILLSKDPSYLAKLENLPEVEMERLLGGNWKIRPSAGKYIKREWFFIIEKEDVPRELSWSRYWDLAVSVKTAADHTASVACAIDDGGNVYFKDMIRGKWKWPDTRKIFIQTAQNEDIPNGVELAGQQGGFIDDLLNEPALTSISIDGVRSDKDKLTRALPWISRSKNGKVFLVRGSWINDCLNECYNFTGEPGNVDDQIDAMSGAYRMASEYVAPQIW